MENGERKNRATPVEAMPARVDKICDAFEADWQQGRRPSIAACLENLPENDRSKLFRKLLALELDYRAKAEESFSEKEYDRQFPKYENIIHDIFSAATSAEPAKSKTIAPHEAITVSGIDATPSASPRRQPDASKAAMPEIPANLVNHPRYRILEVLGRGGMGMVFKAEHVLMKRTVALKVISRGLTLTPEIVKRFHREIEAAAQLSHPNIVAAYDAEQAGETQLLVMEFIEGTDLAQVVKEHGPLSVESACSCIRQAALALQHAHEHRMIHRDIKPHNLMLTKEGQVKVLDFGIARFLRENSEPSPAETAQGTTLGTPDYMAPEQVSDSHAVDIRADIYSLGCSLYHLLTGQVPFPGGSFFDKMMRHMEGNLVPVGQLRSDLPEGLKTVLARMMAKHPKDRYQSPGEVAKALLPFASKSAPTTTMGISSAKISADVGSTQRWFDIPSSDLGGQAGPPAPAAFPFRKGPIIFGIAVLALLSVITYFVQTQLTVRTPNGILEIATDDPDVEVIVRKGGEKVAILDLKTKQTFEIHEGMYHLALSPEKKGLVLEPDVVTLRRDQKAIARIRLIQAPHEAAKLTGPPSLPTGHSEKWVYRNNDGTGCFINSGETDWFEIPPKGEICYFKEVERNSKYVEIYDARRQSSVRLYSNQSLWKDPSTNGGWNVLWAGSWTSVAGRIRHLAGGEANIRWASFAPDGRSALASDIAGQIWVWKADERAELRPFRIHGDGEVFRVAFSPDGRRAASCGKDKLVRVWDIDKREAVLELRGHSEPVRCVAFSSDGKRLVTSAGDRNVRADCTVRVWDAQTGEQLHCMRQHTNEVWHAAFSPDGKLIASASDDGTVRLWDAETGKHLERLLKTEAMVSTACFSPDGKQLAAGGQERSVWVWEVEGRKQIRQFCELPGWITALSYIRDGRLLWVCAGGHVRIRDIASARELRFPNDSVQDSDPSATSLAVSPDGRHVLLSSGHRGLFVWEAPALLPKGDATRLETPARGAKDGKVGEIRRFVGHQCEILSVAFSPDGRRALSGGWTHTADQPTPQSDVKSMRLWDVETGKELHTYDAGRICCLTFTPDGHHAVSGTSGSWAHPVSGAHLWDLESGKEDRFFQLGVTWCNGVAVSSNGRMALSNGAGRECLLWDLKSGQNVRSFAGDTWIRSVAWSPDDRFALTGESGGRIKLWEIEGGRMLRRFDTPGGHNHVHSVAFSPDQSLALACSEDGLIRIWEVATGKKIRQFNGHRHEVTGAVFLTTAGSCQGRKIGLCGCGTWKPARSYAASKTTRPRLPVWLFPRMAIVLCRAVMTRPCGFGNCREHPQVCQAADRSTGRDSHCPPTRTTTAW
jgi:WD40 repeat protein